MLARAVPPANTCPRLHRLERVDEDVGSRVGAGCRSSHEASIERLRMLGVASAVPERRLLSPCLASGQAEVPGHGGAQLTREHVITGRQCHVPAQLSHRDRQLVPLVEATSAVPHLGVMNFREGRHDLSGVHETCASAPAFASGSLTGPLACAQPDLQRS